jgi:xanthine dehydrogenase accessory factor
MTDALWQELAQARQSRTPCALVTVAATKGSVPRAAGSKMLVYADGRSSGTIGGGKFESLVINDACAHIAEKQPLLKTYPLHESSPDSFGAICGGEVTLLIEPQIPGEALFVIGAGHCSFAIAKLAMECGLFVTVIEDRMEQLSIFPAQIRRVHEVDPARFVAARQWKADEALVIVSRNYELDRDALQAALNTSAIGYIGMIGSARKVTRVFQHLRDAGLTQEQLARVYAPLGLDIGADSPTEIAVSVVAELLKVLRRRSGGHLRAAK